MPARLAPAEILRRRLRNQHLIGQPAESPETVVRELLAVQSQDFAGAKWGIGQRTKDATDESLDRVYNDGLILRTHVMRPTWHFVLPDDMRWLLELTAPRVRAILAYYDRGLEIDAPLRRKGARVLTKALRDGHHLTRTEISRAYAAAGIETKGQRLAHLVMHAELDGLICSGPLRRRQFTYALLDERAPRARRLTRDEALTELTLRFYSGHGPATVKDLAWWSGLTQADAKVGIDLARSSLSSEAASGNTYYFTSGGTFGTFATPTVRLLPNYDEYLIAYRDHDMFLDRNVVPPMRNDAPAAHFVVVNGRVIGGWRRNVAHDGIAVRLTLFGRHKRSVRAAIDAEFRRYGEFFSAPVSVTVES